MRKDIVFVILNYNIVNETCDCVETIAKNIDTKNYQIVVVDNGSEQKITNELYTRLLSKQNTTIIFNKNNLGFAQGNNVGINEARKYNPKFICCLNNDTLFLQTDFYEKLEHAYSRSHAALIGPLIKLKDDTNQTFDCKIKSIEEYEMDLKEYYEYFNPGIIEKAKNFLRRFEGVYQYFSAKRRKKLLTNGAMNPLVERENVVLHGCALIFTPVFFEKLKGFNENTFLYREEEILYIMVMKQKMTTLYCPNLVIKHLEDISTNSQKMNLVEKNNWYIQQQITSVKVLIEVLKS